MEKSEHGSCPSWVIRVDLAAHQPFPVYP